MFGIGKKQPSAKVLADQQQNQRIAEGIESANSTREKNTSVILLNLK